ncbi:hypothetical protein KSC_028560 [Ktedonobacter sp. SOSP1-52]|nr:hypothetical protein KSC_028560 [Ktedonobacter sp. SOSP1-52]
MSNFTSEIACVRPPSVFWPLFGLCVVLSSGPTTFLVSLFIPLASFLFIQAALAALLAGGTLWWLVIVRPRRATVKRGFLIGIVGSALAQPLMFLIAALIAAFPWPTWIGDHLLRPGTSGPIIIALVIWDLIFTGWIALPMGGATGVLLIYLQRTLTRRYGPREIISEP